MSILSNYKGALKNFTAYFSASLIPMILNLIANPFISMNMDPEDFAITGYYTSFSTLLTPLVNFYFLQYYIKRYYEYTAEQRHELKAAIFQLLIYYSFFATLLCFVGVFGYIKIFNSNIHFDIFPYLPLAMIGLPLTGIYALELADYKMQRNSKSYFRLSVASGVLNTFSVVLLVVVLKMGAFGKLIAPIVINGSIFIYLLFKYRELLKVKIALSYFGDMFKFCWPLAGAAMLGYFTNGFDKTYLESIGDNTEYGYYCVGASMAAYLHVFSTAISNTFQPDVYQAIATNNNKKLIKTFGAQLGSLGLLVVLFIIFCPIAVYILTAGRYMESIPYTRIISIATFTSACYYNLNCVTIAKGFPKLSLATSIIGSILIAALMPVFANRWQYIGGAWMNNVSFIIFFCVNLFLLFFGLKIDAKKQ